ncbi:probable BOI-related E3 ubiquitin-protein ligase 3 isoform X2 [Dendrobium catenatum]|uniref:RING-type domain-containing protein n=2 Tax=Dendrobium catenatum TaxID=906689 RepID=A0A2I0XA75_9ASPA|nr:probable BOI-related E3 ubiquitin-protein ligase 3 isoform X2 [Dendrobium catenatum]PKU84802.1 hypothetical protein MA16_Dca020513 [Dendrobium catenatum]
MWQNPEHQTGNSVPSMRQQAQINNGDQQPTATARAAYNVSGSGRGSQNVPLSSRAAAPVIQPQQTVLPNLAFAAMPVTSTVGLPMPIDQRIRVFESTGACTSSVPPRGVSSQPGCSLSQEFLSHIRDQNIEIDSLLNHYRNMIRKGIEETQKRYFSSLIVILEKIALKRVLDKDAELANVNRRNSELEEKIFQLCSENQMLFSRASQNEALVSRLKATLEQVLIQTTAAETAPPPEVEGYGDTDGMPFPANDEQSCLKIEEEKPESSEKVRARMVCKVCQLYEMSILLLPCRHICLCLECEKTVVICPICNSSKEGAVQIFMP